MSIRSLFQLALLRLHSAAVSRGLSLSLSLISTCAAAAFAGAALLLFLLAAGTGGGSAEAERFWNVYIEHYVPAFLLIIIFWFVSLFQVRRHRSGEQVLLNTLPLRASAHTGLGYLHTLFGSFWVEAGVTVLFILSSRTVSAAFTARIIWLSACIYFTAAAASTAAESFMETGRSITEGPPRGRAPALAMTGSYLALHGMLVAMSPFLTGLKPLGIGTFFLFSLTALLLTAATRRMRLNRQRPSSAAAGGGYARDAAGRPRFTGLPPALLFAWKNILFFLHGRQAVRSFFSAALLISVLFSLVMNNQSASDRTALLLFLTVSIFTILAYRGQSCLSPQNEPSSLIYTLPVTRAMLFFGMGIPVYINGLAVAAVFTCMLVVTGASPAAAVRFLAVSGAAGAAVTSVAARCAVRSYPDREKAASSFWIALGAVSLPMIIFYPFWLPILLAWSLFQQFIGSKRFFFQREECSS
ncbi:hypothetical protein JXO52_16835 [bacterium]|nr:hypothetical protein [bacterium]